MLAATLRRARRRVTSVPSHAAARSNASSVGSPLGARFGLGREVGVVAADNGPGQTLAAPRSCVASWCSPVPSPVDVDVAVERRDRHDAHPVLGERAGLVGADHAGRSEGLDRAEPLHERAAACEDPNAERECERDRREEALGDVRDDQTDCEHRGVGEGRPASMPSGRNARPIATATSAMSRATRRT